MIQKLSLCLSLLCLGLMSYAQNVNNGTLSPYFFIKSEDGTEQMPLLHTDADANIAGVIADVKVTQVYQNRGKKTIEAIYVFPASTRAAVYNMEMTIGERKLTAIIQEKDQARKTYEQAKKEGKTASLLEQKRPNIFQMNVANILPGDSIKVELYYTELLVPEDGVYEFVYPTVVGPRYSNTKKTVASTDEKWIESPYTKADEKPTYTFDITVGIAAGMPVKAVTSPSHKVVVNFKKPEKVEVKLNASEAFGGNRDYRLKYKLRGDKIQDGVLLYEGEEENFFLMMMQPPNRIVPEMIPPREYIFIVDVSGSMNGFPLTVSKKLMQDLFKNLRPVDKFNILFFAGGSNVLSETSLPATPANITKAISMMTNQRGSGSTQLLPALQRALNMDKTSDFARSFVILTDGYITVEKEAMKLIRDNIGNANFFSFGIGSSINRHLIEGMAVAGKGEPFVVTNKKEAPIQANKLQKIIESPVLHKINVAFEGLKVYDVEPQQFQDLLGERPLLVFGKYTGKAKGNIIVNGKQGNNKDFESKISVGKAKVSQDNKALMYLWARERIRLMDDLKKYNRIYNEEDSKKEVIALGLKYNLLTNYTSFVAVDTEQRTTEESLTIKQPLPMPEGVPNTAIPTPKHKLSLSSPLPPPLPTIEEVPDEAVEEDIEFEDENEVLEHEPEPDFEEIFSIVEQMPQLSGCESADNACTQRLLMDFIKQNLEYPKSVRQNGIEGLVVVRFVIEKDGSISNIKILRSLSKEIDAEAIRLIKLMRKTKKWKPGKQRGKPVAVQYNLPIRFKIH